MLITVSWNKSASRQRVYLYILFTTMTLTASIAADSVARFVDTCRVCFTAVILTTTLVTNHVLLCALEFVGTRGPIQTDTYWNGMAEHLAVSEFITCTTQICFYSPTNYEFSISAPRSGPRPPDKSADWKIIFLYFSSKTYVVGTQKNRRNETGFFFSTGPN